MADAKGFVEEALKEFVGTVDSEVKARRLHAVLQRIFITFRQHRLTILNQGRVVKGVDVAWENEQLIWYYVY